MEDVPGKVVGLHKPTPQEVLAWAQEMSHNFREVTVTAIMNDGSIKTRRTHMSLADACLVTAIQQTNLTEEIMSQRQE